MAKVKIYRSEVRKKKRRRALLESNPKVCHLCKTPGRFLEENDFCPCIVSDEEWLETEIKLNGQSLKRKYLPISKHKEKKILFASMKSDIENKSLLKISSNVVRVIKGSGKSTEISVNGIKATLHPEYSKERKERFLKSGEWKTLRFKTISRDRKCLCCGSVNNLQCDHIHPMVSHWHLRNSEDNLQTLCSDCNLGKSIMVKSFRT